MYLKPIIQFYFSIKCEDVEDKAIVTLEDCLDLFSLIKNIALFEKDAEIKSYFYQVNESILKLFHFKYIFYLGIARYYFY